MERRTYRKIEKERRHKEKCNTHTSTKTDGQTDREDQTKNFQLMKKVPFEECMTDMKRHI